MLNVNTCYSLHNELYRSFELNEHQKPQQKPKHLHPNDLSSYHTLKSYCVAEHDLSTDMAENCWHYLYMPQTTMNREIIPLSIFTFLHDLISSTISTKLWKFSFIPCVWPQASFPGNSLSFGPSLPLWNFRTNWWFNELPSPHLTSSFHSLKWKQSWLNYFIVVKTNRMM